MTSRTIAIAAVITAVAALLYCARLDLAPVHLTKDEASFGIQAHALATTGADVAGDRYPLFFREPGFGVGRDPVYIYAIAGLLTWWPLDHWALRLPSALAGVIAVGLTVLVGRRFFNHDGLAALCGVLALVTPAFFIRSRAALSVVFPAMFQLLWLYFVLAYLRTPRAGYLVAAAVAVGIGIYSYLVMMVFAPLYLGGLLAIAAAQRQWRHAGWATAAFAVTIIPLVVWQIEHPNRFGDLAASYRLYDPSLGALDGASTLVSWSSIVSRLDVYWQVFNPSRLFFAGESSPIDSTRTAGILPLAYVVLLPIGVWTLCRRPWTLPNIILLLALVTAPLPTVLVGLDTFGRYVIIGPLTALVATAGVGTLWNTRHVATRAVAAACVISTVWLFHGFYTDYMGDWRERSSAHFGGNLRGALETVFSAPRSDAPDLVFLSAAIPYVDTYWEFYRRVNGRDDLIGRSRGMAASERDWHSPSGRAMAIVPAGEAALVAELRAHGWRVQAEITEFYGGPPTFLVWTRG